MKLLSLIYNKSSEVIGWADERGRTALHIASTCSKGVRAVELLLSLGASPAAQDMEGRTGLHMAAARGYYWIAKKLVQCSKATNTRGRQEAAGRTATQTLDKQGEEPKKQDETLTNAAGLVDVLDTYKRTALMLACWHGSLKTVMCLLAFNANTLNRDRHGCTPLHIAAWKVQILKSHLQYDFI